MKVLVLCRIVRQRRKVQGASVVVSARRCLEIRDVLHVCGTDPNVDAPWPKNAFSNVFAFSVTTTCTFASVMKLPSASVILNLIGMVDPPFEVFPSEMGGSHVKL